MDTNPVSPESPKKDEKPVKLSARYRRSRAQLSASQKAEAAALWRAGEVTLDQLAQKFHRRPETFSRLFKDMGIKKGEASKEHQAKVTKEVEARILNDAGETAIRIARVKDEHFKMTDAIGKLVWQEIVKARNAGIPLDKLKGTMQTLQLAAFTMETVRGGLYKLLNVEEFDKAKEDTDLPELTIRELTEAEVLQLQQQDGPGGDELDIGGDVGGDLPDLLPEGEGDGKASA